MFGESLKAAIEEATKNSKKRADAERKTTMVLTKWLNSAGSTTGFANPVATKVAATPS